MEEYLDKDERKARRGWRFNYVRDMLYTIAERTYPFAETTKDGKKVYLDQAYKRRWQICEAKLGHMPNLKCRRIIFWREMLNFWGAVLFWVIATLIHYYGGRPWSFIFPAVLLAYLVFQEFVLDRNRYRQRWMRTFIDFIIWFVPIVLFVVFAILKT